jgi:hypothetical protein
MEAIDPKARKRHILATTPPTDILHRAMLVNVAFIPIYNHIFMALPVDKTLTDKLKTEFSNFYGRENRMGKPGKNGDWWPKIASGRA